jgi:dTDP-glucose pyrophosphorylase
MSKPTLVVMAAGIGSRYGGLKQVDSFGPSGEGVIDYAIFDALRAGFGKVVFIIRRDIEDLFREKIGRTIEPQIDTRYVYQELEALPAGFEVPSDRKKPWGTAHALLSAKDAVAEPFAAINADDFYGRESFAVLGKFLAAATDRPGVQEYAMVGFVLVNTVTEHGHVARGVCTTTADGHLESIVERTRVETRNHGRIQFSDDDGQTWQDIDPNSIVSMNMWGLTPSFLAEADARFADFLRNNIDNPKAEFFIPSVVNDLLDEGKARVNVLPTPSAWLGVTYPEDKPRVQSAIAQLVEAGEYPSPLWKTQ